MSSCYWCGKRLSKSAETKDHFISRPMWKVASSKPKNRGKGCICCSLCNNKRSKISSIYCLLELLKARSNHLSLNVSTPHSQSRFERQFRGFLKAKRKCLDIMIWFRGLIKNRMSKGLIKNICLQEINDILYYGVNIKDVELKAYYLWESAGRPHGRHEEFWLVAEKQIWKGV